MSMTEQNQLAGVRQISLYLQEEDLAEAVYDTPWYEMSKTFRKKVHIMSMLARNPFRLTGGRMYHMSLQFFVGVSSQ